MPTLLLNSINYVTYLPLQLILQTEDKKGRGQSNGKDVFGESSVREAILFVFSGAEKTGEVDNLHTVSVSLVYQVQQTRNPANPVY